MKHDVIRFNNTKDGIQVFINSTDLIDMLREYEKPYAESESPSPKPGDYMPVQKEKFLKNAYVTDNDNDLLLLRCGACGEDGCWPMVVRVHRTADTVVWDDFQLPPRDKSSHNYWDYTHFGPFSFNANEYDKQLSQIEQ